LLWTLAATAERRLPVSVNAFALERWLEQVRLVHVSCVLCVSL
jgi:hypothetical protein